MKHKLQLLLCSLLLSIALFAQNNTKIIYNSDTIINFGNTLKISLLSDSIINTQLKNLTQVPNPISCNNVSYLTSNKLNQFGYIDVKIQDTIHLEMFRSHTY